LSVSCSLESNIKWKTCGVDNKGFIIKAQESTFSVPAWVDHLTNAGKQVVNGAVGAASGAASAAAGAAGSVASGVGSTVGSVGSGVGTMLSSLPRPVGGSAGSNSAIPTPFGHRRMQEQGQCSASQGDSVKVAQNSASTAFYYLCPPGKGYCADGKCVFGRTAAVGKGEWATCAPISGCKQEIEVAGGCFPAEATVQLSTGKTKRMTELRVGDKVLAAAPNGSLVYQDVYFFGHRDADTEATFVKLRLDVFGFFGSLTLTPDHFVPVLPASTTNATATLAAARMAYSRDVKVGDRMLYVGLGKQLRVATVRATESVRRAGLFNPYTLGGTIVVDGVLASAHSSWLVDPVAKALGLSRFLPAFFQAAFTPLRLLYAAAGPEFMQTFGDALADVALLFEELVLRVVPAKVGGPPSAQTVAVAAIASVATGLLLQMRRK